MFADESSGYVYSRGKHPTVDILRQKLAALDGAEDALVFGSGAAAIFCSVIANVKAGDHIVSQRDPYSWAGKLFTDILPRFGIETSFVDGRDIGNFREALRSNTKLIYLESPNSKTFELQDLEAVAILAKPHGIITVCDNSYATPLYQQPVKLGIDLVLQSATKYINGHSDAVAGVLSGRAEMIRSIFLKEYNTIGSGVSPFTAWQLLRGLRTMPLRVERSVNTSRIIAENLKRHRAVEKIIFPADEAFAQRDLYNMQMKGAGGMFSVIMKAGSVSQMETFCESLQHVLIAVSWGGHESLVIPFCAGVERDAFEAENEAHRMVRIYCGLEDPEYLWNDIRQALERAFPA